MNDKYSEAVEARLGVSRIAVAFVLGAGGATVALMLAMPMAVAPRLLLATAAACAAIRALDRALRPRHLRLSLDGAAIVDGVAGRLRAGAFVAPWLTAVRWRPQGAWLDRAVLVLPDMLGAEDFRRLRVLLRWR